MFFVTLLKNRHRREGGAEKTGQLSRHLSAGKEGKNRREQREKAEGAGEEQGKSRKSPKNRTKNQSLKGEEDSARIIPQSATHSDAPAFALHTSASGLCV